MNCSELDNQKKSLLVFHRGSIKEQKSTDFVFDFHADSRKADKNKKAVFFLLVSRFCSISK